MELPTARKGLWIYATDDEWRELRKLAIVRNVSLGKLASDALRRDRVTKQAFATKEQAK